ncbi:cytochrome c [Gammaproteobacteria bacterium LSUCC0112]|nr:cytochrome c [Gammaproteobacteria bacterium LSUCC0112]
MRKPVFMRALAAGVFTLSVASIGLAADLPANPVALGSPITEAQLADWDLIVAPDGDNLPDGSGTAAQGQMIYHQKCAACHGTAGEGASGSPALVGGSVSTTPPLLTVGSYWPHASTLFDYVRRAMPPTAPKSLSNTEVYQLTAYVLHLHGVVAEDFVLDKNTLPAVQMPNRDGFIDVSAN